MRTIVLLLIVLAAAATAHASFQGFLLGSDDYPPGSGNLWPRPGQLGVNLAVYTLTSFDPDPRPTGDPVADVPSPLGGKVGFSTDLTHLNILDGSWATWSGAYTDDVYLLHGTDVTLTLPHSTRAFAFYAQPEAFIPPYDITASIPGGPSLTALSVSGQAGAAGFGFVAYGDDYLHTITIHAPADFAIGEFSIAIPAPGALLLAGLGSALVVRMRRRMSM